MSLNKDEAYRSSNPAVRCDVRNCVYHDSDGTCSANKINIGTAYAVSSADTACTTFRQNNTKPE